MFPRHNLTPFFHPEDNTGSGTVVPTSVDDMIQFMGDDDEDTKEEEPVKNGKKPVKSKEKDESDEEEDVEDTDSDDNDDNDEEEDNDEEDDENESEDKLKDIEEELEEDEPDEEKLQLAGPLARREILKKYPKLFKDFPQLETSYYRDREFTNLFTTIDEAKEAADKSKVLDAFDNDLANGNTKTIFEAIKKSSPNTFNRVVDNYLSTLAEVDPSAHVHVVSNVVKEVITHMVNKANDMGEDGQPILAAAQILNQVAFGTKKFEPPKKLETADKKDDDPKAKELEDKERRLNEKYFHDALGRVDSRVGRFITQTIETNIDPKNMMTDYNKRMAIKDATETVTRLINKDTNFMKLKDKLWAAAKKDNYSDASVDRIRRAFVEKAKTLLDSVIKKSRNDALRGMGKRVRESENDSKKEKITGAEHRDTSHPHKSDRSAKSIPAGMTSLEFLMQD